MPRVAAALPAEAPRSRRWLFAVPVGLLALGYLGAIAYLRINERRIVFAPAAYGGRTMIAPAPDLRVEPARVTTPDSVALVTWVIPPADSATATGFWMLVCHGNAGNISIPLRQEWARAMVATGLGLVTFDYRGFGASEDAVLDEAGVYRDAQAVYDWMVTVRGIPRDRIIIYGHSLGSGVATHLAAHAEAAGLVLEGAFTSVPDVGASVYPWLPVRWLATQRFASAARMDSIAMPKLLLHATDDAVIPYRFGEALFAAAGAPKEFVPLTGGHDRAFKADSATYYGAIARWLRAVTAPDVESPQPPAH